MKSTRDSNFSVYIDHCPSHTGFKQHSVFLLPRKVEQLISELTASSDYSSKQWTPDFSNHDFSSLQSNISNTRESVSSHFQTPRRELKIGHVAEYSDELRGVWICDETLSRVFDISSQSKLKLRRKQRNKILKNLC